MFLPLPGTHPVAPEITTATILATSNVSDLASPKEFRLGQDSSYDRRSRRPGTPDWFANEDWGHYLREETNEGRREWVLADLKGPGAVVRQWTANPVGTWRYYFDGETTPRLTTTDKEIAAGRWLGFGDPYAYVAARGCNLYFPLPYAKSLKVTVDDSDGDPKSMYYVLGHRTYPAATPVRTFDGDRPPRPRIVFSPDPRLFVEVEPGVYAVDPGEVFDQTAKIMPGGRAEVLRLTKSGTLNGINVNLLSPLGSEQARRDALGHLTLEADFDEEPCLSAPISALFGIVSDSRLYRTAASNVSEDKWMRMALVMPFHRSARFVLKNRGTVPLTIRFRTTLPRDARPTNLLLHAQFKRYPGGSRPLRDMPVAHLRGQGHYVGTVLQVSNPSPRWWGEGDEKVRLDGEAFPSIWGTGTEDYFGYAWSSPELFARPYHAQTAAGTPGNYGQIANVRWHVLDPIPYTKSLDFDLEQWHWARTDSSFATTAFWYAAPGGTPATPLRARDLIVPELPPLRPEPGAFQGEALEIAERTSGATEIQSGFDDLPDAQLWWKDAAHDGRLALRLPEVPAGRYHVEARVCVARDYGRFTLSLNGQSLGTRDFYAKDLGWKRLTLGTVNLESGRPVLTVRALAPNRKADPRRMFALDWIRLVRVR